MRRALKLLLLLGIGLALTGNKNGPSGTPGNFDKVDPPAKYKGLEGNSTAENHDAIDGKLEEGDPESGTESQQDDQNGSTTEQQGWDSQQLQDMPNLGNIPENRQVHILDGEWDYDTGELLGGGHAPGSGNEGKTEFPERWSDETIMDNISNVARDPGTRDSRPGGGYRVTGVVDGVNIEVLLNADGTVWSAYPLGGDGVVFN
jgi:hypothetical protein